MWAGPWIPGLDIGLAAACMLLEQPPLTQEHLVQRSGLTLLLWHPGGWSSGTSLIIQTLVPWFPSPVSDLAKPYLGRVHPGLSKKRPRTRKLIRQALVTEGDWLLKSLWSLASHHLTSLWVIRKCCQPLQTMFPRCHPKESFPNQSLSFISFLLAWVSPWGSIPGPHQEWPDFCKTSCCGFCWAQSQISMPTRPTACVVPKLAVPIRHCLGEFAYPCQGLLGIHFSFPNHSLAFVPTPPSGPSKTILRLSSMDVAR